MIERDNSKWWDHYQNWCAERGAKVMASDDEDYRPYYENVGTWLKGLLASGNLPDEQNPYRLVEPIVEAWRANGGGFDVRFGPVGEVLNDAAERRYIRPFSNDLVEPLSDHEHAAVTVAFFNVLQAIEGSLEDHDDLDITKEEIHDADAWELSFRGWRPELLEEFISLLKWWQRSFEAKKRICNELEGYLADQVELGFVGDSRSHAPTIRDAEMAIQVLLEFALKRHAQVAPALA